MLHAEMEGPSWLSIRVSLYKTGQGKNASKPGSLSAGIDSQAFSLPARALLKGWAFSQPADALLHLEIALLLTFFCQFSIASCPSLSLTSLNYSKTKPPPNGQLLPLILPSAGTYDLHHLNLTGFDHKCDKDSEGGYKQTNTFSHSYPFAVSSSLLW